MKVFDGHSDILNDVVTRGLNGENNIIKKYHLPKLHAGEVFASSFVIWVEPEHSINYRKRTLEIIKYVVKELKAINSPLLQVTSYDDFAKAEAENKIAILLGLEGMAAIDKDLDLIYLLYQMGIRHGSLTWNEENTLATGVDGDITRGLTFYGKRAIEIMEETGIQVDVSHLNEKSFWDVINYSTRPVIASHSNIYDICPHPRNLKKSQLKAIAETGGLIGINTWPNFVDTEKPTMDKLLQHIIYAVEAVGLDHVAFGFDYCDFLEENIVDSLNPSIESIEGLNNISKIQTLLEYMLQKGFSKDDLSKIAYGNFVRIFKNILV